MAAVSGAAFAVAAIPAMPAVVSPSEVNKSSPVRVLDLRGMETSCCVVGERGSGGARSVGEDGSTVGILGERSPAVECSAPDKSVSILRVITS
ncbi:hypothetical protein JCM13580A_39470 [Streptomyces drozdowiczii]